jgi:hypothetical protein
MASFYTFDNSIERQETLEINRLIVFGALLDGIFK